MYEQLMRLYLILNSQVKPNLTSLNELCRCNSSCVSSVLNVSKANGIHLIILSHSSYLDLITCAVFSPER